MDHEQMSVGAVFMLRKITWICALDTDYPIDIYMKGTLAVEDTDEVRRDSLNELESFGLIKWTGERTFQILPKARDVAMGFYELKASQRGVRARYKSLDKGLIDGAKR